MFRDDFADFCGPETQRAYQHLFNMENYLRFVAKWELVGAHGVAWKDALGIIGVKALEQMEKDAELRLIDVERRNVMSYLMLNQLKDVIVSEQNWDLFSRKLGHKEVLQSQLQVLNRLRGKAMHCRPWTADDLTTLGNALALLSRLTMSYREERLAGEFVGEPPLRRVPTPLRGQIRRIADEHGAPERRRWLLTAFGRVGAYHKTSLALRRGGFSEAAAHRAFLQTQLDCFFVTTDAAVGRMDLYLPVVLQDAAVRALISQLEMIEPLDGTTPVDLEEPRGERLDGVFRLPTQLPPPLRLPG